MRKRTLEHCVESLERAVKRHRYASVIAVCRRIRSTCAAYQHDTANAARIDHCLGLALFRQGFECPEGIDGPALREAIAAFEDSVRREPEFTRSHLLLGFAYGVQARAFGGSAGGRSLGLKSVYHFERAMALGTESVASECRRNIALMRHFMRQELAACP